VALERQNPSFAKEQAQGMGPSSSFVERCNRRSARAQSAMAVPTKEKKEGGAKPPLRRSVVEDKGGAGRLGEETTPPLCKGMRIRLSGFRSPERPNRVP
jgi:hypothetical protein